MLENILLLFVGLFCSVLFLFLMQITFSVLKLLEICIDMILKTVLGLKQDVGGWMRTGAFHRKSLL